ncbi:MAG: acyltransferase [Bacteroidia bacterium]|nr:acyltransferase [Bacteroidia bacterium]
MAVKETKLSIGYFPGLDVLRFICATGVIFHHVGQLLVDKGLIEKPVMIYEQCGSFFLDTFFIISGFLISSILIKETTAGKFSVKNFYLRRIIRIWPLYFLVVLATIVIIPHNKHIPAETIKTNLLYASGFAVNFQILMAQVKTYTILWSVCIEEHIYLLLPLLLLIFRNNFKILSFVLIPAGFISWLYFGTVKSGSGLNTPYFVSTSYFYYFGLGSLLAFYQDKFRSGFFKTIFSKTAQWIFLVVLFLYVFNFFPHSLYKLPGVLIFSGFFGSYLVASASQPEFILSLRPSVSRFVGNISYAMYLLHIVAISTLLNFLLKKHSHPGSAAATVWLPLAATLITAAAASILYYVYERPILKLKNKFTVIGNK